MREFNCRLALAGLVVVVVFVGLSGEGSRASEPSNRPSRGWTITHRVISQEQGRGQVWQVDYLARWEGEEPAVLWGSDVRAEVDGWVSNSRVSSHATPRRSRVMVEGVRGESEAEVIAHRDESRRCRERATMEAWAADSGRAPVSLMEELAAWASLAPVGALPVVVPSGRELRIRLRLEHDHFLYGPYEPLLGTRSLVINLGSAQVSDVLPLDQELRPARSQASWPMHTPPLDRLDREVYVSAPQSLHLEAHVPGNGYYRFTGPVRYATRMRLSYWYLVAPGTEGEARERITQLKQGNLRAGSSVYRSLPDGEQEHFLSTDGRWVHVERVFRTEPEATNLTLEFRLSGDIGEMWLDDVVLEPVGEGPEGP